MILLPIIDRMRRKLSGCKAKNLSLAGRCTLIQSVSSAMVDYSMNTSLLPSYIHTEIERIHRNFLWGEVEKRASEFQYPESSMKSLTKAF